MTPHAELRKEITDWLTSIGAWWVCTNSHGYGRKGIPDILACVAGAFVSIEVKVLPDKLTPWQKRELAAVKEAGGLDIVAYRLADVVNAVGIIWTIERSEFAIQ